ncbi:WD40 repeat-containing protein [Reticulomyxa filosa]|uniref:WD40 repeat-containing protein n=1 Tax=Reticulomyxa filosa TaxID=46433 RepID=X6N0I9_RETFI|nr:WD40 repeat-containing protein [Reticulomyxa filosa]|eukprot:ETO19795.1 WD40 repeat-containing protein [Reticulomyxa filosa]
MTQHTRIMSTVSDIVLTEKCMSLSDPTNRFAASRKHLSDYYVVCFFFCARIKREEQMKKMILVFDGKEGKKLREIQCKDGHKGSVYEVSWSADGKEFITASADKTVKLWDYEAGKVLHTWTFADKPSINDMQVTCLWLGQYILSVSLSGVINFLSKEKERPVKVLTGHRKSVQDLCVDRANGHVYTCDADSRVVRTTVKTGECVDLVGDPHEGTQIKFIRLTNDSSAIYTIGVDDRVVRSETKDLKLNSDGLKLDGAARAVAVGNQTADLLVVGTHKQKLEILKGIEIKSSIEISGTPAAAALSFDDRWLAVGTIEKKILIFDAKNGYKQVKTIENEYIRQELVDVVFSPDGKYPNESFFVVEANIIHLCKYLTSADRNRHIWVWELSGECTEPVNKSRSFQFHNASPSSVAYNPSGKWLVSGGHDNNVYVWLEPASGGNENIKLENAFNGAIRRVEFLSDNQFVGAGADGSIRPFLFWLPVFLLFIYIIWVTIELNFSIQQQLRFNRHKKYLPVIDKQLNKDNEFPPLS